MKTKQLMYEYTQLGKENGFINMIFVLLLFTCISYILGQFGRVQLTSTLAFTLLDLSIFVIVIVWLLGKGRKKLALPQKVSKPVLFAGLFLLVGFISLLLSPLSLSTNQFGTSALYLIRLMLYLSMFFVIRDLRASSKGLVMISQVIVGSIITLVGFIQYIYYPYLKNLYYQGWDDHLYRLFSTFLDPNFTGSFLVLFFLLTLGFFFKVWQRQITKASVGYALLSVLVVFAIMLTYSRTAFLMLLVGVGIFCLIQRLWKVFLVGIGSFIVLFALFANTSLEGLNPFRIASSLARLESAENAVNIFTDSPLLGIGFNAYRYAQIEKGYRSENPAIPSHADSGTDNVYLFVLATTGIIGFSFFVLFFFFVIKELIVNLKKKDMAHTVLLSSLGAVLVGSFFTNLLFYPAILLWLMVLGGVIQKE